MDGHAIRRSEHEADNHPEQPFGLNWPQELSFWEKRAVGTSEVRT